MLSLQDLYDSVGLFHGVLVFVAKPLLLLALLLLLLWLLFGHRRLGKSLSELLQGQLIHVILHLVPNGLSLLQLSTKQHLAPPEWLHGLLWFHCWFGFGRGCATLPTFAASLAALASSAFARWSPWTFTSRRCWTFTSRRCWTLPSWGGRSFSFGWTLGAFPFGRWRLLCFRFFFALLGRCGKLCCNISRFIGSIFIITPNPPIPNLRCWLYRIYRLSPAYLFQVRLFLGVFGFLGSWLSFRWSFALPRIKILQVKAVVSKCFVNSNHLRSSQTFSNPQTAKINDIHDLS